MLEVICQACQFQASMFPIYGNFYRELLSDGQQFHVRLETGESKQVNAEK